VVGQLPREEAALRVGHHRQVAPVGAAEGRDAVGGPVGVEGVGLGGGAGVVDVAGMIHVLGWGLGDWLGGLEEGGSDLRFGRGEV